MIRIDQLLQEQERRTRLLLQVHDELVFESPAEEADEIREMVKREMEGVYHLNVPLVVDTGAGLNWRDAK
jgi:DNA polymerase-1